MRSTRFMALAVLGVSYWIVGCAVFANIGLVCKPSISASGCLGTSGNIEKLVQYEINKCEKDSYSCRSKYEEFRELCSKKKSACEVAQRIKSFAILEMNTYCLEKDVSSCSVLGEFLEEDEKVNEALAAYLAGCRLNDGTSCAYLAEYASRTGAIEVSNQAMPLAIYWLTRECDATGEGRSCDNMRWFSENCDASNVECKNLQLSLTKHDRLQQVAAEQFQREQAARRLQVIGAALKDFGKDLQKRPLKTDCTTVKNGLVLKTACVSH